MGRAIEAVLKRSSSEYGYDSDVITKGPVRFTSGENSVLPVPLRNMQAGWFTDHGINVANVVNYIPIVATVVTCILSLVLARATLRYVEATDKGLELAREEFEREWSPELHIRMQRVSNAEVNIIITNLARSSALLQILQLRKLSHAMPFERFILNDPLVGGSTWTESIGERLLSFTGHDFEGAVAACITFYSAGRMFRTDWFRFNIAVSRGNVLQIDAVTSPARRVRVIQGTDAERFRLDMGKDVTAHPVEQEAD
jgi:hypothetical protein